MDGELFGRCACADLIDTEDFTGTTPEGRGAAVGDVAALHFRGFRRQARKARSAQTVNFAGLDVEELGSVYEALLDYHPQVTIDGERSRFELVTGSERKSTGS